MCGIVGAIAQRNVTPILLEGLKRLEYRGYDSAGLAVVESTQTMQYRRTLGKVGELIESIDKQPLSGTIGIAHTRWATHGAPSEFNAHPQISGTDIALVHNGIIENHDTFRGPLKDAGYVFSSETDTEVVVHRLHDFLKKGHDYLAAVQATVADLEGAFALGFLYRKDAERIVVVQRGCPLVIGIGIGEHFIASDHLALLPVTRQFVYLEEGDIAEVKRDGFHIYNAKGKRIERKIHTAESGSDITDRSGYRHYMLKEIFEQPKAVAKTCEGRVGKHRVLQEAFGNKANKVFEKTKRVQIVACGTSYHAGLVARYWLEGLAGIPCQVEIASEFRYRKVVVEPNTLFVTLSQSGETADTLAALRAAKADNYISTLAICNVAGSSLVRESDLSLMTHAGPEIGVASTKAFTTQLTALLLLTAALGRHHNLTEDAQRELVAELLELPQLLESVLSLDDDIKSLAKVFAEKQHALFLGRGAQYPIALEGALKLKEISYIHAEAYPAGELKHGPLALVDKHMPVVVVAPNDELLEKLKSNLQEVRARGGELIVFADRSIGLQNEPGITVINLPTVPKYLAPIIFTLPLQLLAYHVAVLKGTDVDQPRNLAKSVTVE